LALGVLGTLEQLVHLFICQFLSEACEDMSQFCRVDESVALLVEDLQTLDEVLHTPLLLLPAHRVVDREKLLETNSLSAVWVDFLDNFLDVDLGGVQTEGSKNVSNLIGIYLPVPSLVKQGEGVPEFCDSGGVRDQGQ
jgi:hypothetical protein